MMKVDEYFICYLKNLNTTTYKLIKMFIDIKGPFKINIKTGKIVLG